MHRFVKLSYRWRLLCNMLALSTHLGTSNVSSCQLASDESMSIAKVSKLEGSKAKPDIKVFAAAYTISAAAMCYGMALCTSCPPPQIA